MRLLAATVLTLAAVPALAQPAPPAPCAVQVVRAPEEVRQTIEQMLASEHCTTSLEVRVIPTDRGLDVLANDPSGRSRERVVPNATSAAVLIASWASDDSITSTPVRAAVQASAADVHPPGTVAARASIDRDDGEPPAWPARSAPPAQPAPPARFVGIGAGTGALNASALRAELDLWSHGSWAFGVVGSITGERMRVDDPRGEFASLYVASVTDYAAGVAIGGTARWGNWHVRAGAALGAVVSSIEIRSVYADANESFASYQGGSGTTTSPWGEAHLFVGHSLGDAKLWELEVGPTLSYTRQSWLIEETMQSLEREAGSILLVAEVRRGI